MKITEESIASSAMRSFFVSLFAIFGIMLGIIPLILVFGAFNDKPMPKLDLNTSPTFLPNADGERKILGREAPVILEINIQGFIGSEKLNSNTVYQQLVESREQEFEGGRVKAIILNIDSPGGTVTDSDTIYRMIKHYKEKHQIPVYAYINGLCTSGAMYIASAADQIYASDSSLVGSIGVIINFINYADTLKKIGAKSFTLIAGDGKDNMNPLRPWREGEEESYRTLTEAMYQRFIDIVVANRPNLNEETLKNELGAHVFSAKEALKYGLIDATGKEMTDTLTDLIASTGIENAEFQVLRLDSYHWFNKLLKGQSPLSTGKIKHQLDLSPQGVPSLYSHSPFYYLYSPTIQ